MVGLSGIVSLADGVVKLIYSILNPSQHKLIDDVQKKAQNDINAFKDALLENNWNTIDLYLDGLRVGQGADITPAQRATLCASEVRLNAYTLLGFYARGRSTVMLQEMLEIVRENHETPR